MDLQGAMKNVDAQDREGQIGGAGKPFGEPVDLASRRPAAPGPARPTEDEINAVIAKAAVEINAEALMQAQDAAAEVERQRACHALAAAMGAAAQAKHRAGADMTVWTWRDAEALYEVTAQIVQIEEAAIAKPG